MSKSKKNYNSPKYSFWKTLLSVMLGIAIACGAGVGIYYLIQALTPDEEPEAASWGTVYDEAGNELNDEDTYALTNFAFASKYSTPMSLELTNPSVTLSASTSFEYNVLAVDWAVTYNNGADASDVVTVTPYRDGSLTATVECIQAFDEQLTLTVTVRGVSNAKATVTIDYIQRIEGLEEFSLGATDIDDNSGYEISPTFGKGTVKGSLHNVSVLYNLSEDFKTALNGYLTFNVEFTGFNDTSAIELIEYNGGHVYVGEPFNYSHFIKDFEQYDGEHKEAIYLAWYLAYSDVRDNVLVDVTIALHYNGAVFQTYTESDIIGGYITGDLYGSELSPNVYVNESGIGF